MTGVGLNFFGFGSSFLAYNSAIGFSLSLSFCRTFCLLYLKSGTKSESSISIGKAKLLEVLVFTISLSLITFVLGTGSSLSSLTFLASSLFCSSSILLRIKVGSLCSSFSSTSISSVSTTSSSSENKSFTLSKNFILSLLFNILVNLVSYFLPLEHIHLNTQKTYSWYYLVFVFYILYQHLNHAHLPEFSLLDCHYNLYYLI